MHCSRTRIGRQPISSTARRANTPLQRHAFCARLRARPVARAPARALACTWGPALAAVRVHVDLVTGLPVRMSAPGTPRSDSLLAAQALGVLWGRCEGDKGSCMWALMACGAMSDTSLLAPRLALRPHTATFRSRARAPRVDARYM